MPNAKVSKNGLFGGIDRRRGEDLATFNKRRHETYVDSWSRTSCIGATGFPRKSTSGRRAARDAAIRRERSRRRAHLRPGFLARSPLAAAASPRVPGEPRSRADVGCGLRMRRLDADDLVAEGEGMRSIPRNVLPGAGERGLSDAAPPRRLRDMAVHATAALPSLSDRSRAGTRRGA